MPPRAAPLALSTSVNDVAARPRVRTRAAAVSIIRCLVSRAIWVSSRWRQAPSSNRFLRDSPVPDGTPAEGLVAPFGAVAPSTGECAQHVVRYTALHTLAPLPSITGLLGRRGRRAAGPADQAVRFWALCLLEFEIPDKMTISRRPPIARGTPGQPIRERPVALARRGTAGGPRSTVIAAVPCPHARYPRLVAIRHRSHRRCSAQHRLGAGPVPGHFPDAARPPRADF